MCRADSAAIDAKVRVADEGGESRPKQAADQLVIEMGTTNDQKVIALGLATGSRTVDVRMVQDIPSLARSLHVCEVGAGLAPSCCGGKRIRQLLNAIPAIQTVAAVALAAVWIPRAAASPTKGATPALAALSCMVWFFLGLMNIDAKGRLIATQQPADPAPNRAACS